MWLGMCVRMCVIENKLTSPLTIKQICCSLIVPFSNFMECRVLWLVNRLLTVCFVIFPHGMALEVDGLHVSEFWTYMHVVLQASIVVSAVAVILQNVGWSGD